jgi:hypothetical protein
MLPGDSPIGKYLFYRGKIVPRGEKFEIDKG